MDLVELKCGMALPEQAIVLAIALEDRGWRMTPRDGKLHLVGGRDELTDADREAIRTYRDDLLRIAQYDPKTVLPW